MLCLQLLQARLAGVCHRHRAQRCRKGAPVAIPTLALGHFSHHALICFRSVVASLTPCSVRGCLPGCGQASPRAHAQFPFSARWSGNTRQPCAAQRRADAFPDLRRVIGFPNPIHQIQLRSKLARDEYGIRGEDFARSAMAPVQHGVAHLLPVRQRVEQLLVARRLPVEREHRRRALAFLAKPVDAVHGLVEVGAGPGYLREHNVRRRRQRE